MIVVTIELWPKGDQTKSRPLGKIAIYNEGTGTEELGNYRVYLSHSGKYYGKKGAWKTGKVEGHRRALSPYHLVYRAIKACLWPKQKGKGKT